MDERVEKWLYDIKLAIEEVDEYFETQDKIFEIYRDNILLKRAIERNLEIIGEATNRILNRDPGFQLENARQIIGLRNRIIHSYDSLDDEAIWGIIVNHLPLLKEEVDRLLK